MDTGGWRHSLRRRANMSWRHSIRHWVATPACRARWVGGWRGLCSAPWITAPSSAPQISAQWFVAPSTSHIPLRAHAYLTSVLSLSRSLSFPSFGFSLYPTMPKLQNLGIQPWKFRFDPYIFRSKVCSLTSSIYSHWFGQYFVQFAK